MDYDTDTDNDDDVMFEADRTFHVGKFITLSDTELNTAMDINWKQREVATRTLTTLTATSILQRVIQNVPQACTVVLREDTSHLPAHGHVDDILSEDGETCMPHHDDWHDLEWTHEIDEAVWDLYYISSSSFTTEHDGVRRLRITA